LINENELLKKDVLKIKNVDKINIKEINHLNDEININLATELKEKEIYIAHYQDEINYLNETNLQFEEKLNKIQQQMKNYENINSNFQKEKDNLQHQLEP
jgi:phosphoribosylpyrophosphate synthetase